MVGTRQTPSSGRKGCRELKGLVSSVNYQARDSRKGKGKEKVQGGGGGLLCCPNECENHILECEGVER